MLVANPIGGEQPPQIIFSTKTQMGARPHRGGFRDAIGCRGDGTVLAGLTDGVVPGRGRRDAGVSGRVVPETGSHVFDVLAFVRRAIGCRQYFFNSKPDSERVELS